MEDSMRRAPGPGMDLLVRMERIVKRFGAVEALKGVDLDLVRGRRGGSRGDPTVRRRAGVSAAGGGR
jgi:hypothetical protein